MPTSAEQRQADSSSLTGRVLLGRYRVMRPLARGGMGVVYLGRVEGSAGFAKPVVIKTLLADDAQLGEGELLFAREARIVSHLQHPGIVAVIDFGKLDTTHVMVLEYVHGYNLGQWFRYATEVRGGLKIEHAVHVMLGVLDALAYAHGLLRPDGTPFGIMHRDIAPGNVLIDVQGHVKLADFGIARTADDEFKTQQGMFRGTLPFCAPEVLHSEPVDGRVDQYACAVLLYQLLTGVHPFKGGETAQTITRILTHTPPPASSLRADVPPAFDAAIAKAMSKAPEDRYASAAEFAEALRRSAGWSEREIALDFAAQIERDFQGDLPTLLDVEPLAERDAAWRDAQDTPSGSRVALHSSPPEVRTSITKREGRIPSQPATLTVPVGPQNQAAAARAKGSSTWALVVIAGLAAVAAVAALLSVLLRPSDTGTQKLVVVEKQAATDDVEPAESAAPAEPIAAPSARISAETAPSVATTTPPASAARAATTKAEAPRGAPLARAFQRQEGAIQRCFQQNPDGLAGSPRLAVKFNVDREGHVIAAGLDPPSVAGQPLGRCVLSVARATEFGPQPEAVSFSIPIAARVVRH